MEERGVRGRDELRERLGYTVGKTTIYRSFDERWGGEVSFPLLVALVGILRIPIHRLVREPGDS